MPSADFMFHDILRLRINHRGGPFMGQLLGKYARYRAAGGGEPDLEINIGPFQSRLRDAFVPDGYFRIGEGMLACEHRYKVARWKLEISGWENGRLKADIDPNLPARVVVAGDTVPALIRYALVRKGALLVHGSAVESDGEAVVFAGRSGAGKTITATRFIKAGFRYLGDDSCILKDGRVYGFIQPFNVRFTYDAEGLFGKPFTARERASILGKRILSLATAGKINLLTSLPPEKLEGARMGTSGRCARFVLLQGGPEFSVETDIPREAAVSQTLENLRFECRELDAYMLAYAHVFPGSAPSRFWQEQAALLSRSLAETRIFRITVPKIYTDETFRRIREAVWDRP